MATRKPPQQRRLADCTVSRAVRNSKRPVARRQARGRKEVPRHHEQLRRRLRHPHARRRGSREQPQIVIKDGEDISTTRK